MAGAILCVSCAQLPCKDRSLAVKKVRCTECQSAFGVTSYGTTFRILPPKHGRLFTPGFITGVSIGAACIAFVMLLVGMGLWSQDLGKPQTRTADPAPPEDLARVREVAVDDPFHPQPNPVVAKQNLSAFIARIKQENAGPNKDAFVLAQMERRPELRGLPFVMGTACRLDGNRAQSFQASVQAVRNGMDRDSRVVRDVERPLGEHAIFWDTYLAETQGRGIDTDHGVAALTQILGPERQPLRHGLVRKLASSNRPEATRILARAALFDVSSDVRVAALKELKNRPRDSVQDEVLMQGIRYPMTVVAYRAAHAIGELDRQDLKPELAKFLDQPAPGDPEKKIVDNREVCEVREMVRINHHRNCLLCHPPSATGQPNEVPGVMPIPGTPFPSSPSEAYGAAQSIGDPMVRADTTYLRQDFSVLLPVANAAPWPNMQRFDFLVRSRIVEGDELAALMQKVQARPADFLSANHKAALDALRRLTGQDAAPNLAAWQRVFGGND